MTRQNIYNAYKHEHYGRWYHMNNLCINPKNTRYKYYGGRGIKVYFQWHWDNPNGLQNYSNYIKDVLGPKPDDTYTIDRIDYDDDYKPGNLRWISKSEQRLIWRRDVADEAITRREFSKD